jgi:hypothetical protein
MGCHRKNGPARGVRGAVLAVQRLEGVDFQALILLNPSSQAR